MMYKYEKICTKLSASLFLTAKLFKVKEMKRIILVLSLLFSNTTIAGTYDQDLMELFELTSVKNSYIGLNNVIINQMQNSFFQAADQYIDANSLTEEQRQQIGNILRDRFTRLIKSYELHVQEVMSYDQVVREVYLPLYKEIYTHDEVKALLKFYNSPLGIKTLESTQRIADETRERSAEKYDPIIVKFMEEKIEEHISLAKEEIASKVTN